MPWINRGFRYDAAYHYLTYLAIPAIMALSEGIYKLPASFYLKVDTHKNIIFHEWYTPLTPTINYSQQELLNEKFCVTKIRELLRSSVHQQMMSNMPVGVFLSRGIDSSLNVVLMSEFTQQINTFTITFSDGPEFNELEWARKVVHHFGTQHHEIIIEEKEAYEFFTNMIYYQDEPLGDCVCIPLYYVAKLLKESGVTVVQIGEGSDELFCEYNFYVRHLTIEKVWHISQHFVPAVVRRGVYHFATKLFPQNSGMLDVMYN